MPEGQEFGQTGRCWARSVISKRSLICLKRELNTGSKPGARIDGLGLAKLKPHMKPVIVAAQNLLPNCRPVRAIVFNKTSETNWAVGWHQDRVIAVQAKQEIKGFENWSQKSGTWHCEPPIQYLENMIFARLHLDASTDENGCVELALGSHAIGAIPKNDIAGLIENYEQEACVAEAGDALFAKALILHRSRPSRSDTSRLALRIDFANIDLPAPLQWAY